MSVASLVFPILVACAVGVTEPPQGGPDGTSKPVAVAPPSKALRTLADAPSEERDTIERLRHGTSWVRRAFAAERLTRFECDASAVYLRELLQDESWHVRCYAILGCARRSIPLSESTFANERSMRVLRTALRCRYEVPREPLERAIVRLAASDSLEDKMLALELAVAAEVPKKTLDPIDLLGTIVLRMDRVEAGSLSPRLAAITTGKDSSRSYRWRDWFRKNRKDLGLHGGFLFAAAVTGDREPRERGLIAELSTKRMIELERRMQDLSGTSIDLTIALDCTSSMSAEIAECQAGVDALMLFAQDVAKDLRVAIVGYRDVKDQWETKGWDFTRSIPEARERLWQLSAEGGGDRPESVAGGLKIAYAKMSWQPTATKSLVLVGDAPPHPGTGEQCVEWAKQAFGVGIRTYTIAPHAEGATEVREPKDDEAVEPVPAPDNKPGLSPWWKTKRKKDTDSPWRQKLGPGEVEYWKEIAAAGGGRSVSLPRDASLIAEIAGLTLGDTFQDEFGDFFDAWMSLCR